MHATGLAATILFAVGGAHAQTLVPEPEPSPVLLPQPEATLSSTPLLSRPFGKIVPVERSYLKNVAEPNPMARLFAPFTRWATDPRLLAGVQLTPFLALEAGYVNLYDRGTHPVDSTRPEDLNGAMNVKGMQTHAAAKVMVPVGSRWEAYGKLGMAYSEYKHRDELGRSVQESDTGVYAGAGAKYKLSEKASVSGSFERYGNSERWGGNSNNNAVKAKVNLGF
ncbi:outer membrane beta-barrel protein [Massilia sp. TN1-12]|uniref:outer membrane beta-barrel protein n=1 Tax=Massilia paldalensis TaxID=3377675 RepID=UPI00384F0022